MSVPGEDAPIYVAASWRTPRQQEVVAVLRAAGLPVYDFRNPAPGDNGFGWREIDGGWQNWTAEQFVSALKHPIAQRGFTTDMNALRRAPAVILVQPSGRSAALEFGWGRGAGKPGAVLLAEGQEPELMLGMADLLTTSLDEIVTWAALATRGAHVPPPDALRAMIEDVGPREQEVLVERKRFRIALEKIAEHDAAAEAGFVDEWVEANAYSRCKEIARAALSRPERPQ